jgi:hypothetical protein
MAAKHKPKRGKGGDGQYDASEPALALRDRGLCLCQNGIQSAPIISQPFEDESVATEN